jgi:hypothetical protein
MFKLTEGGGGSGGAVNVFVNPDSSIYHHYISQKLVLSFKVKM